MYLGYEETPLLKDHNQLCAQEGFLVGLKVPYVVSGIQVMSPACKENALFTNNLFGPKHINICLYFDFK